MIWSCWLVLRDWEEEDGNVFIYQMNCPSRLSRVWCVTMLSAATCRNGQEQSWWVSEMNSGGGWWLHRASCHHTGHCSVCWALSGGHHAHIGVPDTGGDINVNECQRRIWISSVTMMWHAVHIYFLLCKFAFYVNSPACLFPYSKQTTVMSDSGTVYLWGVLCCGGRGQQQER